MCTVTIITSPLDGPGGCQRGIRMVCNRDESRLRPAARPPRLRKFGNRSASLPVDPLSGGTWIAANDAGLVFALLNVNARSRRGARCGKRPDPVTPRTSRGRMIPRLLGEADLRQALALFTSMDLRQFEPFRLVMADRYHLVECLWADGRPQVMEARAIDRPFCFTSSGLGDEVVAVPRRRLFAACFSAGRPWRDCQDSFHSHSWPGQENISVWMTRADALTVSRTQVDLCSERVAMHYYARVSDCAVLVGRRPTTLLLRKNSCHAGR